MGKYSLYSWNGETHFDRFSEGASYKVFRPTVFRPLFWPRCRVAGPYKKSKLVLVELLWALSSLWKYKLYYVEMNNQIVHMSYVVFKSFKFPFLAKKDYQIGPCYTANCSRGKGIYASVIDFITQKESVGGGVLAI